ncbi:putative small ubiquitin-related modifier [Monocercomonoides exilis]|uniref:putative small ubiquitin-related modifier n=1 Tax=Monocercomonoides exilis TaxID=2049356 RepID=UPI003559DAC1|nr:putative small ubiquitin-related modifier [Monocercomonoides exilis]
MSEEADKTKTEYLNVRVRSATGEEVYFKIKRSTPLKKLMAAYCSRENLIPSSVRFMLDGTRVNPTDTPEKLDMEDGDMIDAEVEQTGGC